MLADIMHILEKAEKLAAVFKPESSRPPSRKQSFSGTAPGLGMSLLLLLLLLSWPAFSCSDRSNSAGARVGCCQNPIELMSVQAQKLLQGSNKSQLLLSKPLQRHTATPRPPRAR